eukprot:493929_1
MESSLMESLQNNNQLLIDVRKSLIFKINNNNNNNRKNNNNNYDIISFDIIGSFPEGDKNKFLMDEILKQLQEDIKNSTNIADKECDDLPLHKFNEKHLLYLVRSWILKDNKYKKIMKQIMESLSKHKLSGSRLIALGDDMKHVLQNETLQYMTNDTFNISIIYLNNLILNIQNEIISKSAPEIGQIIAEIPLINLSQRIEFCTNGMNEINGNEFLNLCVISNDKWIKDTTGWNDNEILQIKYILLQHNTQTHNDILHNIINELLLYNYNTKFINRFKQLIELFTLELDKLELCVKCAK